MGSPELGSVLVPSSVHCGVEAGSSRELASRPGSPTRYASGSVGDVLQGKKVVNDAGRHLFSCSGISTCGPPHPHTQYMSHTFYHIPAFPPTTHNAIQHTHPLPPHIHIRHTIHIPITHTHTTQSYICHAYIYIMHTSCMYKHMYILPTYTAINESHAYTHTTHTHR